MMQKCTNCVETETQKWTWDMGQKKFDPSLHKNMSPFWWAKKRGFFLPPSLPYGPMSPSQQFFFFECIPNVITCFLDPCFLYIPPKRVDDNSYGPYKPKTTQCTICNFRFAPFLGEKYRRWVINSKWFI